MAEKISDLSGAEREQRIAELKQKMHAAAKRAQAEHADEERPAAQAGPPSQPAAIAEAAPTVATPAAATATQEAVAAEAPVAAAALAEPAPKAAPKAAPRPEKRDAPSGNGAAPKAAPRPAPAPAAEAQGPSTADMNRREFLTYAWGGALGFLALGGAVGSFLFMYPRFKAGEFGGKFFIGPESVLPDASAAPVPQPTGKFWLVRTEEGEPRALYMVCTHLGCLYKWEASNVRFECPCHGSKFTHDGYYIEGPAPRSLDTFIISVEEGQVVVDTGAKIIGNPSSESPARAVA